jgi:large subunit ribosomal protein L5
MNRLKQHYLDKVAPALQQEFGLKNVFQIPKVQKVVLNMGITDTQGRDAILKNVVEQFRTITGRQPVVTKAKKSIAGFKLRQGESLGVKVTLRGEFMWQFMDKLISVALPRVKDFQGVSATAFDPVGNYSLGMEEQIVFPEIDYDSIESVRGLQVVIVTSTKDTVQSKRLLTLLGMPFVKEA